MRYPHLKAAALACAFVAAALALWLDAARRLERQKVHAIAAQRDRLKISGSVLARAALRSSDLLLIVGASEALTERSSFQSGRFFERYPTGFSPFEVARGGANGLTEAELVSGLGSSLHGKKVVITYTPHEFELRILRSDDYARNFSLLHATQLVFGRGLHLTTRRLAARRMLQYRQQLRRDPLLGFAVHRLAAGGLAGKLLYYALLPLGRLQLAVLNLQDHYVASEHLRHARHLKEPPPRHTGGIDWERFFQKARTEERAHPANNPFGIKNLVWTKHLASKYAPRPPGAADRAYLRNIQGSVEWTDLEILLRVLRDLGAEVLVLGRPMKGSYYDALGISAAARARFYARMRTVTKQYGATLVDFHEFEYDDLFGIDHWPHTGKEGWVYVNRILDQFYHGTLGG